MIKNIFKDIDKAIKETESPIPVTMEESKFLKKYLEIKERYLE